MCRDSINNVARCWPELETKSNRKNWIKFQSNWSECISSDSSRVLMLTTMEYSLHWRSDCYSYLNSQRFPVHQNDALDRTNESILISMINPLNHRTNVIWTIDSFQSISIFLLRSNWNVTDEQRDFNWKRISTKKKIDETFLVLDGKNHLNNDDVDLVYDDEVVITIAYLDVSVWSIPINRCFSLNSFHREDQQFEKLEFFPMKWNKK